MKRIAVFSDVHGNLEALEAILEDIEKEQVDEIISLGDVIAIGPNPKECLDLVLSKDITMILGNHELFYLKGTEIDPNISSQELEHQVWVRNQLGEEYKETLCELLTYEMGYEGKMIDFFHFFIKDKSAYPFYDIGTLVSGEIEALISYNNLDYDYAFYGHHHYYKDFYVDDKKIYHVETAGCRKDNMTTYLILELGNEDSNKADVFVIKKYIPYNRDKFLKKMKEIDYPEKEFLSKVFFGIE